MPNDIGRIPNKVGSGYAGFTAEQWRNWVILFSLYSLRDILPQRDFSCWQFFVKACYILCNCSISLQELNEADRYIMEFLLSFERLYGKEFCNINLHLHAHLKSCILDFGPVYSFWCFPFERMNGILGSYRTNCHDISVQLMRRFIDSHTFVIHNWSSECKEDFVSLIDRCIYAKGSLLDSSLQTIFSNSHNNVLDAIKPLPPVREYAFEAHIKQAVHECISRYISMDLSQFEVLHLFQKCNAVKVGKFVLGSCTSRFTRVSIVKARFQDEDRLAEVQYFVKCCIKFHSNVGNTCTTYWLAAVSFFNAHQCKVWFGKPMEVWSSVTDFDIHFIPVTHISK